MIFHEVEGSTLFSEFSFNHNRQFLPFGRADLTTCAMTKLSSRAKRGDFMMIRQRHEIASLFRAKRRNLLRSSQRRLRRYCPFAVDDHSFMGRALHMRQSRLVNNSGLIHYIFDNWRRLNLRIFVKFLKLIDIQGTNSRFCPGKISFLK